MSDPETARRVVLRSFCLVSFGLAASLAVLGFYPGYELRVHEFEDLVPVASSPPGLVAVMAILASVVAHVWRRPTLANALLGSMVSVGISVFMLTLTAAPSLPGGRTYELPAGATANKVVLALAAVQIGLLPIACGLLARAARARRGDRLARARVHRIGR